MTRTLVIRGALTMVLVIPALTFAQDVTEPALKAAFIYSFAQFTEWPADAVPAGKPLLMCVLGDDAISSALERAVKAREIGGRSVSVSYVTAAPTRECHVLYVSRVTASQATNVVASLRDVPVLTISDLDGFIVTGGIAQFYFEHGRLRFMVRLPSAKRARLQISSRLLALAKLE